MKSLSVHNEVELCMSFTEQSLSLRFKRYKPEIGNLTFGILISSMN